MLRLFFQAQIILSVNTVRVMVVVGGGGGGGEGTGLRDEYKYTSPGLVQRSVSFIFAFQWNYRNGRSLSTFFAHRRTLLSCLKE